MLITPVFRAKIIEAIPGPDTHYPPAARVLLLDEGRITKVETRKLYELPPACSLEKFPLEIVEVSFLVTFIIVWWLPETYTYSYSYIMV